MFAAPATVLHPSGRILRIAIEEIKLQRIVAFEVVMSKLRITGVRVDVVRWPAQNKAPARRGRCSTR